MKYALSRYILCDALVTAVFLRSIRTTTCPCASPRGGQGTFFEHNHPTSRRLVSRMAIILSPRPDHVKDNPSSTIHQATFPSVRPRPSVPSTPLSVSSRRHVVKVLRITTVSRKKSPASRHGFLDAICIPKRDRSAVNADTLSLLFLRILVVRMLLERVLKLSG